jgi:hypothetical protein
MKTSDLARSKRLKELGWKQESEFYWQEAGDGINKTTSWIINKGEYHSKNEYAKSFCFSSPTAGEMIEWIIRKSLKVQIASFYVYLVKDNQYGKPIEYDDDNIENALADACIWVMENDKDGAK